MNFLLFQTTSPVWILYTLLQVTRWESLHFFEKHLDHACQLYLKTWNTSFWQVSLFYIKHSFYYISWSTMQVACPQQPVRLAKTFFTRICWSILAAFSWTGSISRTAGIVAAEAQSWSGWRLFFCMSFVQSATSRWMILFFLVLHCLNMWESLFYPTVFVITDIQ